MLRACALTARTEITACARPSAGIFGDFGSPVIPLLGEVAIFWQWRKIEREWWVLPGSKCSSRRPGSESRTSWSLRTYCHHFRLVDQYGQV